MISIMSDFTLTDFISIRILYTGGSKPQLLDGVLGQGHMLRPNPRPGGPGIGTQRVAFCFSPCQCGAGNFGGAQINEFPDLCQSLTHPARRVFEP